MSVASRILAQLWHLPAPFSHDIVEERDIRVTMRDGVELLLDRYHPRGGDNLPVVLIRSPYGRGKMLHHGAVILAERGFQVLLQSCRGTEGCGGTLHPSFNEENDGSDTIDWIGSQSWFCGKLAIMGASYMGNAAWAAVRSAGPKIAAMALAMTLSDSRAETYAFEGFTLESCLRWTRTIAHHDSSLVWSSAEDFSTRFAGAARMQLALQLLPLRNADRAAVGRSIRWWRDWVEHGEPNDPFWQPIDYSTAAASAPPTALIAGWHDVFLPWEVKDFEAAQAAGRDITLTIGPWKHSDREAVAETLRQALPLFQTHLLDASRPATAGVRAPVRLFVIGANEWREYRSWPPPETIPVAYYLAPGGALSNTAPAAGEPSRYNYDPSDPTPSVHGPNLRNSPALGDMAELERRFDVLLFTGEPLDADLDVVGPVWAEVFFRSDLDNTDFFLCLCDVDPEARSTNVCDGYIRVRPNRPVPLCDGTRCVRIEFWPTAYRYKRGHRIRVIVASGAHPRYARNPGTGEALADAVTLKIAHQQIFHDSLHPTRIVVGACSRSGDGHPTR
jgi:putative CocE/NonD family hydrolase